MKKYAIIMAGGTGERLFPLSTTNMPKQFLSLYGKDIMINETIKRVEKIVSINNIFIIVNKDQENLAKKYIDRRIREEHILIEPKSLNTAVCIAYATMFITSNYGEGIISIFSSDHYISNSNEFTKTMKRAFNEADKGKDIYTIGVKPEFPCTQFGYINYEKKDSVSKKVIEFIEKPNIQKAIEYVKNGYLWNSGIFVWRSNVIKECYKKFLPEMYKSFFETPVCINTNNYNKKIEKIYSNLKAVSIDVGIIEKAKNVRVIIATFDWMDIGNLDILMNLYEKENIRSKFINNYIGEKSKNVRTLSFNPKKIYTTIGIEDIIIVDTEKICLIAKNNSLDSIRKVVEKIKNKYE